MLSRRVVADTSCQAYVTRVQQQPEVAPVNWVKSMISLRFFCHLPALPFFVVLSATKKYSTIKASLGLLIN